ncbi:LOB domain-containing protein 25-like [Lotus japonicus]|uniref:LOB domain-containing protein 25-like n=1 Tax=Lotus japonicus TaxID=34305 RepID=UPI00258994E0|nr:LOB domain-containing protein 25-like [Lotus japonicus]
MGSNPCLICKHLGKPCFGNCEFGQYFPVNREEEFSNACRHFGISNILRNMRVVQPHERQATAKSLLIESTIRRNDPVRGCLGVVLDLQSELETLNKLLKFYRDQACPSNLNTSTTSIIPAPSNPSVIASSTQIPTLAESPSRSFPGIPIDLDTYFSTFEKGQPSAMASKGKLIVEDEELEANDEEENITSEED